ncbi:MAG: T9SS type A sorting domain-containing protein [Bacteroidota bacterium]|nr:T9SS type A sorting domain-containing protein [Bacteroidota bacterium]
MRLSITCLCLAFLLNLPNYATAANRFWVAAAPSNWNNTASWSTVSGGAGGASVPGVGDAVTFNNVRLGNCAIDIPVSVLNITVTAGYTGIISQNANAISVVNNASFSGGVFTGGSSNITIGGNFTLAGTTFTSTSATLEFDGNATFTSASFSHNNGTVRFKATGGATTIAGTSPAFFVLEFVGDGFSYNITSTGNISVSNSLNLTGASVFNLNTGAIDVTGDINSSNTAAGCAGSAQINIIGAGAQSFNGSTVAGAGGLPKLSINKPSGTLSLTNFPASSNDFTYTAGTIDAGSSTYCFTDGSANPYTITGSLSLNNIEFLAITNQTFTIAAATTLSAPGDFTMAGTSRIIINAGNINVSGNIFLSNTAAGGGGTATLNIVGAGNESMDGTAIAISQNLLPLIVINKPGGTLTLKGNISESRNWTFSSGTVDAASFLSTVAFGGSALSVTSAGMNFYNVTITGNAITATNDLTIKNNLNINAGRLAPGANTVNIAGSWNNYGTAGFTEATSTVNFNGAALQTITSSGGENFANLVVNNSGTGIQLINNTTIAGSLTMLQNNINLNGNILTLGISVANNGTLGYTAGTIVGTGIFTRWFKTGVIADRSVNGLFPMGTATDYRPFFVSAPAAGPTTGGSISVSYNDATTNTSVPVYMDGAATIMVRKDLNWAVSTNGLAGGTYSLAVQGTGFGLIGAISDLRLTLANSVAGLPGVNAGTTTNPQINRTGLTLANLTNSFYVGSINSVNTPLPITLISFNAYVSNGEVKLEWSTSAETNNAYFIVQKSKDAQGWEEVQKILGAGTSSSTKYYSCYDITPYSGISYYRLMQADIDGKQSYSPIVLISLESRYADISVYPNPVTDQIKISFPSANRYEVSLINIAGQILYSKDLADGNNLELNVSGFKPGIYFIHIMHEAVSETRKILIAR